VIWKTDSRSSAFRFARLKAHAIAFRIFSGSGIKVVRSPALERWMELRLQQGCLQTLGSVFMRPALIVAFTVIVPRQAGFWSGEFLFQAWPPQETRKQQ
jgi:hypothetical protein